MLSQLTLTLFFCIVSVSTIPMIVYEHARFDSISTPAQLTTLVSVLSTDACACQCYQNLLCVTGTFFGSSQICDLFGIYIEQGQLQTVNDNLTSTFSFPNKSTNIDPGYVPPIIEWLFDGNFNDVYGRYNGELVADNGTSWVSPGYAGYGSAVYFLSRNYSLVNYYLNLTAASFTISAWIWMSFNITREDFYFTSYSHCESNNNDKCLHTAIVNGTLYFGFFGDDLSGNTQMKSKQWYHVAYVYNRSSAKQLVYLNGNLDGSRTPDNSYSGNASQIVLGTVPSFSGTAFLNGFVDKLTFVSRVKNASELLDEATLVAYYPFDNSYMDSGPNSINNSSGVLTTFNSAGQFNQALLINSTNSSYFQTTGFYYLGQTNYSHSFAFWIYPFVNSGTILQVMSPNGWCVPMIGFSNTGQLTIQTLGAKGVYATSSQSGIYLVNRWTHVSMTYSTTNGIQLFVNGLISNTNNASSDYVASNEMNTIVIGTSLQPNMYVANQTRIVLSQFHGKIDELKIFSRELSASDISQLMGSP